LPIAVVEAKEEDRVTGAGLQQAMGYAEKLGLLFAYSSSGHGFEEWDFTTNTCGSLRPDTGQPGGEHSAVPQAARCHLLWPGKETPDLFARSDEHGAARDPGATAGSTLPERKKNGRMRLEVTIPANDIASFQSIFLSGKRI